MAESRKKKSNRMVLALMILIVLAVAFFVYQSGILGIGNSCAALKRGYDKAAEVEDYPLVSEYFSKLSAKGCEF